MEKTSPELDAALVEKTNAETLLLGLQQRVEDRRLFLIEREINMQDSQPSENRVYTFYGAVGPESVSRCIYELDNWSRRFPGEDITILFNSMGGNIFDGFALYDFLLELKSRGHKIITKAFGMAASMAATLLQAGDERVIGENTFLMIHETSGGVSEMRSSEIEDVTKLLRRYEDKSLDILAERATLSRTQIKNRWKRKDFWLDAKEALKYGLVDRIG